MTRTQSILSAALVVQLLLLLLVAAPWSSDDGTAGPRILLPELEGQDPSKIEIDDGDKRLVLSRQDGVWQVDQAQGYPADSAKVDKLIDDLKQLEVRRPVVSGSRYHDALKVSESDNERRLSVWEGGDGDPDAVLYVGSSPNYGVNHVRRGDEDAVYEARGLSPWDLRAEADSWIDKQLIDVSTADVTALTLTNEHGQIVLRREEGSWVLEAGAGSEEVDQAKVDSFVGSVASLRFSEPAGRLDSGKDFGFAVPAARVELVRDVGGEVSDTFELIVGGEADPEAGTRYAHAEGSAFAVVLTKTYADRLLDEKAEGLLASPDEAATDAAD